MHIPPIEQIKSILELELRPLIEKIGIQDKDLNKAIKSYEMRLHSLSQTQILVKKPHCLFDWAVDATSGIPQCVALIKFAERQISELLERLDSKFHKAIKSTGKLMVLTFDENPEIGNNPRFMNYLAELAGLNHILQIHSKQFELLNIEKKLPNSKSADFEFLDTRNNDRILVEFMSLHGLDIEKVESNEELIIFLESRFSTKLAAKTIGLNEEGHRIILDDGFRVNFTILPIIWNEMETLLPYKNAFVMMNAKKYVNVLPCLALLPQLLEDRSIHLSLTSVSNILEMLENQRN